MIIEVIDTPHGRRFLWTEQEYVTDPNQDIPKYTAEVLFPHLHAVCESFHVRRNGEVLTPRGVVTQLGPGGGNTPMFCCLTTTFGGDYVSALSAAVFNAGDEIIIEPGSKLLAGTPCPFFSKIYWLGMIQDPDFGVHRPYVITS